MRQKPAAPCVSRPQKMDRYGRKGWAPAKTEVQGWPPISHVAFTDTRGMKCQLHRPSNQYQDIPQNPRYPPEPKISPRTQDVPQNHRTQLISNLSDVQKSHDFPRFRYIDSP